MVVFQVRHGAGTGLREILKSHGSGGGKLVGSTAEQVYHNLVLRSFDSSVRTEHDTDHLMSPFR